MSSPSFFIYTEILTHKSYIKLKSIKFEHMELSFMQNIGDTLKFIRKSKNLTQQETCTNALSRSNYQKIKIIKSCLVWTVLSKSYLISI